MPLDVAQTDIIPRVYCQKAASEARLRLVVPVALFASDAYQTPCGREGSGQLRAIVETCRLAEDDRRGFPYPTIPTISAPYASSFLAPTPLMRPSSASVPGRIRAISCSVAS